jgi:hypothetical protein
MCDLMHVSQQVPVVSIERTLQLGDLIAARNKLNPRPSWFAVFIKAWAIVAGKRDELRRSFLSFPWPRLFQHPCNMANVAIARQVGSEDVVLSTQIRSPEQRSLNELDAIIRHCRTAPVEEVVDFRRQLRLSRLPWFVRRPVWWVATKVSGKVRTRFIGTYGVTSVAALGCNVLHILSPGTITLSYGVFASDGSVPVQLFLDHRVLDGVQPSNGLEALERVLLGPILEEMHTADSRAA